MWIKEKLSRCNKEQSISPKQFWEEMRDISGLVVEKEVGLYEFSHQTFQEYLAACHGKELGKAGETILFENLANDRWREVICFYAAQQDATRLISKILDTCSEEKNLGLLELASQCRVKSREISQATRQRLDELLLRTSFISSSTDFSVSKSIAIRSPNTPIIAVKDQARALERFKNHFSRKIFSLSENISVRPTLVSWGEFQLFLQDVSNGQFHATVELNVRKRSIDDKTVNLPITWNEARWFCGWLSTQAELASDEGIYHYRLPTKSEWQEVLAKFPLVHLAEEGSGLNPLVTGEAMGPLQPFIQSINIPGNALYIMRERVHPRYSNLINYLANAQWQEADEETEQVMLEIANRKEQGYLDLNSTKNFPCKDLQFIDHLWLKFSGGRFGFSVQKEIYVHCGGKTDYKFDKEALNEFGKVVGWKEKDAWTFDLKWDLNGPRGNLPFQGLALGGGKSKHRFRRTGLFSRIQECAL